MEATSADIHWMQSCVAVQSKRKAMQVATCLASAAPGTSTRGVRGIGCRWYSTYFGESPLEAPSVVPQFEIKSHLRATCEPSYCDHGPPPSPTSARPQSARQADRGIVGWRGFRTPRFPAILGIRVRPQRRLEGRKSPRESVDPTT
jgi:hypothetical protein